MGRAVTEPLPLPPRRAHCGGSLRVLLAPWAIRRRTTRRVHLLETSQIEEEGGE